MCSEVCVATGVWYLPGVGIRAAKWSKGIALFLDV
ncbi:Uncharacterised protein [Dermatophilus congolensis]|uniref:Uncharacterized protein n=1 Tax=Dermatophilus congolensis TaxID=1863 RepID=A0AA46BLS3_9MICO|nr:Uncharacterised protein [Dermatophilus congolensis]